MFILAAIVLAGLVTNSQQMVIPSGYRDGNCSASAFLNCDSYATCTDSTDGKQYICQCRENATGDGFKTTVGGTGCKLSYKPCATSKDCPQYGSCTSDYKCQCNKGFTGDGFNCTDINECPSPLCDPHAFCQNYPGTFKCVCDINNHYVGDGFNCTFKCGSNNDCDAPRAVCNDVNACVCIKGYSGDGRNCTDTDECSTRTLNNCNANATCINTPGSFKCECKNGYIGNGVNNCTALPRNCREIPSFVNGNKYLIDPDFTGPAKAFIVTCNKINNIIVTILAATGPFPMVVPDQPGTVNITYGGPEPQDIIPFLEGNSFCYQEISFTCNAKFNLLDGFVWKDAYGRSYNQWGSTINGQCACGEVGMCAMPSSSCNCDGKQASVATDSGRIVDKSRLPVISLSFSLPFASSRGSVDLKPLVCADKPVGIPKDCYDAKFYYGQKKNDAMYIKPDPASSMPPYMVYCEVEKYYHAGVTIIPPVNPVVTPTTVNGTVVEYRVEHPKISALITGSKFCTQKVEVTCRSQSSTGSSVKVTSAQRPLGYFPGGAGVPGACGCGATQSCDSPLVKCNCDIGDDITRTDFGIIINKTDLPVVSVSAQIGDNKFAIFKIGPIMCSQIQFAIEPNCDKIRMSGATINYTYFVDPDGPQGKTDPIPAECLFIPSPPQGYTIIHHDSEKPKVITDLIWIFKYLLASKDQIEALKVRSTFCTQKVTVGCQQVNLQGSAGTVNFLGPNGTTQALNNFLETCGANGTSCNCNGLADGTDSGSITDMANLPINSIDFSNIRNQLAQGTLTVTVGPLVCSEIFPTCALLQEFLLSKRVAYGESYQVDAGTYTIDADGLGGAAPFEVNCNYRITTVTVAPPNSTLETNPNNSIPIAQCFNISYVNGLGSPISKPQINALAKKGKCKQDITIECKNAPVSGKVYLVTCDGKKLTGLGHNYNSEKCSCGINGNCAGGPLAKCNCDLGDSATRYDGGTILLDGSAVCLICFEITPKTAAAGKLPPVSSLKYKLGALECDGNPGTQGNCQEGRLFYGKTVTADYEGLISSNSDPPVPLGCKMLPNPPVGILTVKATNNPITTNQTVNIRIDYVSINISIVIRTMSQSEFCSQKIYFFCASDATFRLGGSYGWYNFRDEISYEWTQIPDSNDAITTVCTKNSALCTKCGRPKGVLLTKKESLPVARLSLITNGATIVIGDAECLDIKKNCQEIMDAPGRKMGIVSGKKFVIDVDGPGILPPNTVNCEFDDTNQNGVTEFPVIGNWTGPVRVVDKDGVNNFEIPIQYDGATPEQISTLAQTPTGFCFQGFKYECSYSPIHKDNQTVSSYKLYNGGQSRSLGTGEDVSFDGCACGKTGTCLSGYSCNCDAVGKMGVDQGTVTNTNALPIVSVSVGGQTKGVSSATVYTTNVRCSPKPIDPPRDCDDALKRKSSYGINYTSSSEYLISPNPRTVNSFMVRCEMDIVKNIGITVIVPNVKPNTPLSGNPDNPNRIPYYGVTDNQILAVIERSAYCYQGVKFTCIQTPAFADGSYWLTLGSRDKRQFWGGGEIGADGKGGVCACGKQESCGGLDSATAQRSRRCNCDAGDNVTRIDAGIIVDKQYLPISQFWIARYAKFHSLNITVGNLTCSPTPLTFDECSLGYHDCHPQAMCIDEVDGYRCVCNRGYEGKGRPLLSINPRSNGRECIDDDECVAYVPCPYSANCTNIPGDFYCTCNPGYRQTGKTSCEDINECADPTLNSCDPNARCENLDGSYRCLCERGYRGDGFTCIPIGECSCFGDTHCVSYDDRWLHYMSECETVMSQDGCHPGETPVFRVLIQQWKKNNTQPGYYSWIKSVRVQIFGKEIVLEQNNRILVDGIVHRQYFDEHRLSIVSYNGQSKLQTVIGLEVTWDGKDVVQVIVPENSARKVCGLCGNYDSYPQNDWSLGPACPESQGQQTDNEHLFGQSWTVVQNSTSTCNVDCSNTKPPVDTCNLPMAIIEKECDKLMNINTSPFKTCLMLKKPSDIDQLIKSCKTDLCHVEDSLDEAVCRLAQYMSVDCANNEKVENNNWKKDVPACGQTKCPYNMVYKTCGPAEPATCIKMPVQSVLTNVTDVKGCNEGCFCEEGLFMENDRCITERQCGCTYNNGYMATNDVVVLSDCSRQIQCLGKNQTLQSPVQCKENEECSTKDGKTGCYCKEGYTMKPGQTKCEPDACTGVVCSIPNMECVNGSCACKMGYTGDCNQCDDVDECATGLDNCDMVGQTCINLDGSFKCGCKEGFVVSGQICKDIDECEYGIANCGNNSECANTPGGFKCVCCDGYKKDANGNCVRDLTITLGANPICCACKDDSCNDTSKVCGTDGNTYSNYRSLSVAACKSGNADLKVEYKGACQGTCSAVTCEKQYANCTVESGKPKCSCPSCEDSSSTYIDETVCATNKVTYISICHMKQATCEADIETKVEIEHVGRPCPGKGDSPITGPWSDWSDCSEECKQGTRNRTRDVYVSNKDKKIHDKEEIPCYNTCPNGPCKHNTCVQPGQVCVADDNNKPSCQCPTCELFEPKPICTRVLNVIKTYENECELEKTICEMNTDDYEILEPRACEDKPTECGLIRNYKIETLNGCTADRHINFGACYGGCDDEAELCCKATEKGLAFAIMYCRDGTHFEHSFETTVGCSCIPKPQEENDDKIEG